MMSEAAARLLVKDGDSELPAEVRRALSGAAWEAAGAAWVVEGEIAGGSWRLEPHGDSLLAHKRRGTVPVASEWISPPDNRKRPPRPRAPAPAPKREMEDA